MKIISYKKSTEEVTVKLSIKELAVLKNCLNETVYGPHAVKESEFDSRVGMLFEQAEELLKTTADIVHRFDESYRIIK